MNFRKVKAVLDAIGLTIVQVIGVFLSAVAMLVALSWLLGSGYYLIVVLGSCYFSDPVVFFSETDYRSVIGTQGELWLFWSALGFWILLALGAFVYVARANYVQLRKSKVKFIKTKKNR